MSRLRGARERLAAMLSSAFAQGLLSEQTHAYRLGLLFGSGLIDEQLLVGGITLRSRRSPLAAVRRSWRALATSRGSSAAPLLLALDHAGSDRILVGRDPRCDIVLADRTVSRRHAQVTWRDGGWVLRDLASTNGTFVNGTRVARSALVRGDIVELGQQTVQVD